MLRGLLVEVCVVDCLEVLRGLLAEVCFVDDFDVLRDLLVEVYFVDDFDVLRDLLVEPCFEDCLGEIANRTGAVKGGNPGSVGSVSDFGLSLVGRSEEESMGEGVGSPVNRLKNDGGRLIVIRGSRIGVVGAGGKSVGSLILLGKEAEIGVAIGNAVVI